MTPPVFVTTAILPALSLLPAKMDSPEAQALILAVALHESGLTKRRQFGKGPARSYVMFERAGIRGVVKHPKSRDHARDLCKTLDVLFNVPAIHRAIEFQDVLAVGLARLLLLTLPKPLPAVTNPIEAWYQYLEAWRPGKPREEPWKQNYTLAWAVIQSTS